MAKFKRFDPRNKKANKDKTRFRSKEDINSEHKKNASKKPKLK